MIGAFPSSLLENVLLGLGSGFVALAFSLVVPRSWGWMAFPLVLIATWATTAATIVLYLHTRYDGYNIVVTSQHLVASLAIISLTFWITLAARRWAQTHD